MDKEEIIKKIKEILDEDRCFHSCNDDICKFYEYYDIVTHKLTDDFWEWVDENEKEMLEENKNKIKNLLKEKLKTNVLQINEDNEELINYIFEKL